MGAIDISEFVDIDIFKHRIDSMFDKFKTCLPAPGFDEVILLGEN